MTRNGGHRETPVSTWHLFVMDPLQDLNLALDSSLRLMFQLSRLGQNVAMCEPRQLMWESGVGPLAIASPVTFDGGPAHPRLGAAIRRPLGDYRAIHMRKDPPYDLDYISTTWLLDGVRGVSRIYNDPEALRRYNEKLAILRFPAETRAALASSDPKAILSFVEGPCHGDAVLKPLTLFGGRGVIRLTLTTASEALHASTRMTPEDARLVIESETQGGRQMRLVQPFDPSIFEGEVRVFTAFGEPMAWCLKRPAPGAFLANTRAGATLLPYAPPSEVEARVRRVAGELLRDGVVFIGFDLIGGYVSEINLTSPRLLQPQDDDGQPYERLARMVVRDLET